MDRSCVSCLSAGPAFACERKVTYWRRKWIRTAGLSRGLGSKASPQAILETPKARNGCQFETATFV
jgi:hypothetical protein